MKKITKRKTCATVDGLNAYKISIVTSEVSTCYKVKILKNQVTHIEFITLRTKI